MNKFLHGLITMVLSFVISALTMMLIWKWFIHPLAPTVLVSEIPWPMALGLSLFMTWGTKSLIVEKAYTEIDEPYDPTRSWYGVVAQLVFLGLAALYHWFM